MTKTIFRLSLKSNTLVSAVSIYLSIVVAFAVVIAFRNGAKLVSIGEMQINACSKNIVLQNSFLAIQVQLKSSGSLFLSCRGMKLCNILKKIKSFLSKN